MWETIDPDGRKVILDVGGWTHILEGHPYIGVGPEAIVDVVTLPDGRLFGPRSGEEWFYRRALGPSAWIRVVVHFEHRRGVIVTAFPRRSMP